MIKIIFYHNGLKDGSKLKFCRMIKELSGITLRESKDIVDWVYEHHNQIKTIESNLTPVEARKVINEWCPPEITIDDLENQRNIKILSLGIGTDEEYREALRFYLGFEMSDSKIIDKVVQLLNRDQMIELAKDFCQEFYGEI